MAVALISTAMISSCVSNLIISKITSTAGKKLYNYIYSPNESTNISLDDLIRKTDIQEKVNICKIFIDTIHNKDPNLDSKILSLKDIIIEIEALLNVIEQKKQKHKSKYFKYYRTLNLSKEKKQLVIYDEIISRRLDFLIKILSI